MLQFEYLEEIAEMQTKLALEEQRAAAE